MAEPIELITELEGKDAERFLKEMEKPTPNPKRDKTIKRAMALKVFFD
jgi:hypothetical protein